MTGLLAACEAPPPALVPTPAPPPPQEHRLVVRAITPAGFLAGAQVCVASPSGAAERCATSDQSGSAAFTLRTGTYLVRGTPPAKARLKVGVTTIDVTASGEATVVLEGLGRIAGRVSDTDGKPVPGARVCAHPAESGPIVCARTGPAGAYALETRLAAHKLEIEGPADGSRLLGQWAHGRLESFEADVIDLRLADATGVNVVLRRGVSLSGVVRAQRDGLPVAEAQVCTQTLAMPLPWQCEQTDAEGRYAAVREPGRYWVWTIPPGLRAEESTYTGRAVTEGAPRRPTRLVFQRYDRVEIGVDATPFPLFADATYDVSLGEGAFVTGRLSLPDGRPVAGALVCIDTPFPTGRICRESGADGIYAVATRPETYAIQIVPPAESGAVGEWWPRARDWTDASRVRVGGADVRLDVVLRPGERIYGFVRTEEGVPVESAPVSFNDARGFFVGTYTDHAGRYDIVVPRGDWLVDVFAPRVSQLLSLVGAPLRVEGETGFDVVLQFARP